MSVGHLRRRALNKRLRELEEVTTNLSFEGPFELARPGFVWLSGPDGASLGLDLISLLGEAGVCGHSQL